MSITKTLSEIMGTKEQVAMSLMDKFNNNLIDVMNGTPEEYINVMGIGKVAAKRLDEAFQLHTYIYVELPKDRLRRYQMQWMFGTS